MSQYLWKLKQKLYDDGEITSNSQVKLFPPSNSTQNINQMGKWNKKENMFRKSSLPQVYFSYPLSQQITRGCATSKWEKKSKNLWIDQSLIYELALFNINQKEFYLNKILSSLNEKNIKSEKEIEKYLKSMTSDTQKTDKADFSQRDYSAEEMNALFDSLEDIEI